MPFWEMLNVFLGIFLTMAILGVVLTHSGEFTNIVQQAGQTTSSLFRTLSFQTPTGDVVR
jgi:hypothetical protein